MITVGIIGLGYWGTNLARVFHDCPQFAITAMADTAPDRRAALQSRYPHVDMFTCGSELIASGIDAVVIAAPLREHYTLAVEALNAGKHVLVEKPFTASSEQAQDLIRLGQEKNLVVMVDHTFVYNPAVLLLADLIKKSELGDLLYFDSRRINLGLFRPDADVVWDLAVHDLAILDYLVGVRPSVISAVGAAHLDGLPNNTAFVTLQYPNQFVAHIDVNWLSPVKVRQLLIGGSRKMVIYDDLAVENRVRVYDCGADGLYGQDPDYRKRIDYRFGDMWAPHIAAKEPLAELAAHFGDCITGRAQPRSGADAGLRVVRMLEIASLSQRMGGAPLPFQMKE